MNRWLIGLIVGVIGLVIALIFEDSREWLYDTLMYILSFEWFGELWEFITGIFDNIGEFGIGGLVFGVLCLAFTFFTRQWMLDPFINQMGVVTGTFWMIATYIGSGFVGYLVGHKMFDE